MSDILDFMNKTIVNKLQQVFAVGKSVFYKKNEIILRRDDDPQGAYFVETGYVRMLSVLEDGKELTFNIFKPGSFFPMMWALGDIPNKYDFSAMTDVHLKRLSKEKILQLTKTDHDIFSDLMKRVLLGLDGILTNIEYLLSGSAKRRILAVLLLSAKRFGDNNGKKQIIIQLPMTHQDMANLCGLTRETVSLIIEELTNKKLISSQKQLLTIENMELFEEEIEIYKDEALDTPAL